MVRQLEIQLGAAFSIQVSPVDDNGPETTCAKCLSDTILRDSSSLKVKCLPTRCLSVTRGAGQLSRGAGQLSEFETKQRGAFCSQVLMHFALKFILGSGRLTYLYPFLDSLHSQLDP